ncbi:MAG: discoidin domain-containing protein [Pseudomonadota bacterium]
MKSTLTLIALLAGLMAAGGASAATNVAPLGTASESSELQGWGNRGAASHAIDGDIQGDYWAGNGIAHTGADAQAWWQVQLDHGYSVGAIDIYNRTDCCNRLNNFTVTLYDGNTSVFSQTYASFSPSDAGPNWSGMHIDVGGAYGDRVRVQLNGQNYLQLAEVKVSAVPEPEVFTMLLVGLGLLGFMNKKDDEQEKFEA